jgi:hypothetical protein
LSDVQCQCKLTSWRVLQHSTVVVSARHDLKIGRCDGLASRVTSNDLNLAGIVLAGLRDIKVIHAVIRQLVALTLKVEKNSLASKNPQKIILNVYIDHSVTVDEPHDTWSWMSSDAAAESRPFALLDGDGIG